MNKSLEKNVSWECGEERQNAFDNLKARLCEEGEVLRHQDLSKPLILHTHWSNVGIGAVLGQMDDSRNEYTIA